MELVHRCHEGAIDEAGIRVVVDVSVEALQPRAAISQGFLRHDEVHGVPGHARGGPRDEEVDAGLAAEVDGRLEAVASLCRATADTFVPEDLQHLGAELLGAATALLDLRVERHPLIGLPLGADAGIDHGRLHRAILPRRASRKM
ncbi:MAG: hypothetical protein KBC94_14710 [Pseudacidovorax sp.]|nr:hypothetical protein [Pseudacidovorax sp.]MBP6895669.1 hypothetical protein [Pseudacidovorax sp.]